MISSPYKGITDIRETEVSNQKPTYLTTLHFGNYKPPHHRLTAQLRRLAMVH